MARNKAIAVVVCGVVAQFATFSIVKAFLAVIRHCCGQIETFTV
jgi:hypothetical protein